ncbi:tetraacyldisaccharide 4'-kinase [Alkalilimnicola ehrlichii]|uniref:tetraacyldisaccharide 4'-kinase n=1 Tax=Alkalilimnicola ehrlichii TaxID=351052 RepID=UPI000E2ED7BB|nr:tetraacyldisaccharide 4'-kinase [Alkalilimnicola ehrlichii]RFA24552.1 tetraacyldisaccharide 4'-kinase [Alkalilimnicola ehrlichii]
MAGFPDFWLRKGLVSTVLLPLAGLYRLVAERRRRHYQANPQRSVKLPRPVIVVGNIFVGGTGKTPIVVWLSEELKRRGCRPGIITRGYGGSSNDWPQVVSLDSDPVLVGDEPVLLAQRTGCPVVADPNRVAAAQRLLSEFDCDVVISDDGLQHYRLARDLEIVVVDAQRGLGNGRLLPAGPLREAPTRLEQVDLVIANGDEGNSLTSACFQLHFSEAVNLLDGSCCAVTPEALGPQVHAVAGIGHPERFFQALRGQGFQVATHAFADHHRFQAADLAFADSAPRLMTEKDAVKCRPFATGNEWCVPVTAVLNDNAHERLQALLDQTLSEAI